MSRATKNAIIRERRREAVVRDAQAEFCGVCSYYVTHCRCAGARLYLRERYDTA
jgi:hypothetical protein